MKLGLCILICLISVFTCVSANGETYCKQLRDELEASSPKIDNPTETNLTIRPSPISSTTLGGSVNFSCSGNKEGIYIVSVELNRQDVYELYTVKGDKKHYDVECSLNDEQIIVQTVIISDINYSHAGRYLCIADGFRSSETAPAEVVVMDKSLTCSTNIGVDPLIAGPVCGTNLEPDSMLINCSLNYAGNISPTISFQLDDKQFNGGNVHNYTIASGTSSVSTVVYMLRVAVNATVNGTGFSAHAFVENGHNYTAYTQPEVTWHSPPVKIAYFSNATSPELDIPSNWLNGHTCPKVTNLNVEYQWLDDKDMVVSRGDVLRVSRHVETDQKFRCVVQCSFGAGRSSAPLVIQTVTATDTTGESDAGVIVGALGAAILIGALIGGAIYTVYKWKQQGFVKASGPVTGVAEFEGKLFVICTNSNIVQVFTGKSFDQQNDLVLGFLDPISSGDLASSKTCKCLYLYATSGDESQKSIWRLSRQDLPTLLSQTGDSGNSVSLEQFNASGPVLVVDGVMSCRLTLPEQSDIRNDYPRGFINVNNDGFDVPSEAYLFRNRNKTETWLAVKWKDIRGLNHENTISVSRDGRVLISKVSPPCVEIYNFDGSRDESRPTCRDGRIMLPSSMTEMQHAILSNSDNSDSLIVSHGWKGDSHRVCEVSLDGQNVMRSFGERRGGRVDQLNCPNHLAMCQDGNIYVADCDNNRVLMFTPEEVKKRKDGEEGLLTGWQHTVLVKKRNDFPSRLCTMLLPDNWLCLVIGWRSGEIQLLHLQTNVSKNSERDFRLWLSYMWRNGRWI